MFGCQSQGFCETLMYGQEMYHSVQKIFIVTTNRNRNRKHLFKICVWCFKSETKGQNFVRLHIWLYYLFAYLKQNQSLRKSVKFKDCTYTLNKDLHLALFLSGLNCWPIPRALPLSYDIHSQGTNKQTNSNTHKNSEIFFFFFFFNQNGNQSLDISYWIISWLTYILMLMECLVISICQTELTESWGKFRDCHQVVSKN